MTRRRIITVLAIVVSALVLTAGLIFKPWLIFVDTRVSDTIPQVAQPLSTATPAPTGSPSPAALDDGMPQPTADPEAAEAAETGEPLARQLSAGTFISHEHPTTGTARVIEQPDGSRVLAIENLDTTSGPDVHVWLSAADVVEGRDGWYTAGTAAYVDLGPIKGNQGDQLYEIPEDVDLSRFVAVSLWCVPFGVSFAAAQLES